jgi:hypothetical protein
MMNKTFMLLNPAQFEISGERKNVQRLKITERKKEMNKEQLYI